MSMDEEQKINELVANNPNVDLSSSLIHKTSRQDKIDHFKVALSIDGVFN